MNNQDIAKKVVDRIVELIDSGASLPWIKPWNKSVNTVTIVDGVKTVTHIPTAWNRKGVEYKGCNTYLPDGEYITFNQCKAEGGTIKKGAKAFPVVYWNFIKVEKTHDDGSTTEETVPMLKYYQVFNVNDCEGITQKHQPKPITIEIPITHVETVSSPEDSTLDSTAETIIAEYVNKAGNNFHIDKVVGGDRAYYSPSQDYVSVPAREQFKEMSEYYSTLFHELGHSTGHTTRLNRFTGKAANAAFGSQEYSKEELVAEATSASILSAIGLEQANTFRNSAAYIKSWASNIKNDPMMYISAMTKAQSAFDMIVGVDYATTEAH